MNAFDDNILLFLNSFARHSFLFDVCVGIVASNPLFKGGLAIPVLWWLWFRNNGKEQDQKVRDSEHVLAALMLCFVTIVAARGIAFAFPFRPRPIHNPLLHFTAPYTADVNSLIGWSAFPSDHAALFFALATGILPLSRTLAACGYLHAFVLISLPRVYLGLHQPTDILAGAVVGICIGSLVRSQRVRSLLTRRALDFERIRPGLFYACFFFVSCQLVLLFDPIRTLASDISSYLKHHF